MEKCVSPAFRLPTSEEKRRFQILKAASSKSPDVSIQAVIDATPREETRRSVEYEGNAFFQTPLTVSELSRLPRLAPHLVSSNVFVQRKIDLSNRLIHDCLFPMLNLVLADLEDQPKPEEVVVENSQKLIRYTFTAPQANRSVLLVESISAQDPVDIVVEQLLDEAVSVNSSLWLVSYLATIDKRLLSRFNSFFVFDCSERELSVVRDLVVLSPKLIQALQTRTAGVLFFSDLFRVKVSEQWPNPTVLELT